MKISVADLQPVLAKYRVEGHQNRELGFRAITVLQEGQRCFEPDILYVGRVSQMEQGYRLNPGAQLILVADGEFDRDIARPAGSCVLVVKDQVEPLDLHRELKACVDELTEVEEKRKRILSLSVRNLTFQQLANALAEIMNNPIAFSDISFKTLGYSDSMVVDDFVWNEFTAKKDYPVADYLQIVKNSGLGDVFASDDPCWSCGNLVPHRRLGCKISNGDEMLGWVTLIEYNQKIKDSDIQLLKLISQVLQSEFRKDIRYSLSKGQFFEHVIADLLNGTNRDPAIVRERVKQLRLRPDAVFRVLAVKPQGTNQHSLIITRKEIESILTNSRSLLYGDSLIMLIEKKSGRILSEPEMTRLRQYLSSNRLVGGLSRSFCDLIDIRKYYSQAIKAIELGTVFQRKDVLFTYDRVAVYHLFQEAHRSAEIGCFVDPLVRKLLSFDRTYGADYARSLHAYLNNRHNVLKAAKSLGIHRNTMAYRVNRIKGILNADIDDSDVAFRIQMSFRLLEYISGGEPSRPGTVPE